MKATDKQIAGNHYKELTIQPVEFCQKNELNYCESAIIKYVCRHRNKNGADDIQKVIDCKLENMDSVVNCMSRFDSTEATNRNIPKVVSNFNNDLIYMSRSAIPGTKEGHSKLVHKQVCIYAFTKDELDKFYQFGLKHGKTQIEWSEDIEILRFLELGINVKMLEPYGTTQAVDVPEDVNKVLEILNERKS